MPSALGRIATGATVVVTIYAVVLGALLRPEVQRFALYAHKFNTLFYHDINKPEEFGFAKNQVTAFYIETADGEKLYAWHVLPIDVYTRNENLLVERQSNEPVSDFTKTTAFHLLTADTSSPARVVVNFHGNAGHIAQGWRTDTYHTLTRQPNTHVITIDYRGFGKSSGYPTEAGLVTDGIAITNWVMQAARIPPDRIVLLGQSLGTAVASAVALSYVDSSSELLPREVVKPDSPAIFAGVILVAPFSSLPSLMQTYRIGGFLPILLPFKPLPFLSKFLTDRIVDTWDTADRLKSYYFVLADPLRGGQFSGTSTLQVLHARDDFDIAWEQSDMIYQHVFGTGERLKIGTGWASKTSLRFVNNFQVRFDIVDFGGHNRIMTYSAVAAAVVRAFEYIPV